MSGGRGRSGSGDVIARTGTAAELKHPEGNAVAHHIARRMAGIALSIAVVVGAPGCEDRSAPPVVPVLTEDPVRPPRAISYKLSGTVTDDQGAAVPNAQLTAYYANGNGHEEAWTDALGHYSIAFATVWDSYDGSGGIVGAITYAGGGEYESYAQAVPWGTANVVKDLHLRRVRTINAGESIVISIDPDSSVAYNGEWWTTPNWVRETFHIRVAAAGTLTVVARPASGGVVPSIAVGCVYVTDCSGSVPALPWPAGTVVLRVGANSLFEGTLEVPAAKAPQRYEVITSLQ